MKKLAAVMLATLLFVGGAFAATKSNSQSSSNSSTGKVGIGYSKATFDTNLGSVNIDEVAGRYWFSDDFGIDFRLGFGSGDVSTRILVGANFLGKILNVNRLNVYWLAGINFGSFTFKNDRARDIDCTLFGAHGGVGAEFFVLPCLSVLTEMGVRFTSVSPDGEDNATDFGIFADWLPQAGVRFYF